MYPALLNQSPPAPYAMSSTMSAPMAMPQVPTYAHGGKVKRGKMVVAHMNPHELHVLDHIQGKIERCPKSGMRSYSHLEELLKNPHILANVHHHAREHHAMGEEAGHHDYHDDHLNHLAAGGMHGDSELALIGPHTHHVFNQLANGGTINPYDGHPQYFSLRNALGGLWDTVKGKANQGVDYIKNNAGPILSSAGQVFLPRMLPHAQQMAKNNFGSFGKKISESLPGLAKTGLEAFAGPGGSNNPYAKIAGQGLQAAYDARNAGKSWGEAAGQGISRAGQRMSESGVGPRELNKAMIGAGNSLAGGKGIRDALSGGFENAGGKNAVKQAAIDMMQKDMPAAQEENPYEGMAGMFG